LDPTTDIPELLVTVAVGDLTAAQRSVALSNALQMAEGLTRKGVIRGALAAVGRELVQTTDFRERVAELAALA
ncbi:MAG: hypothetical protein WAK57_00425, partial [Desulfobacterales bacterium]